MDLVVCPKCYAAITISSSNCVCPICNEVIISD